MRNLTWQEIYGIEAKTGHSLMLLDHEAQELWCQLCCGNFYQVATVGPCPAVSHKEEAPPDVNVL